VRQFNSRNGCSVSLGVESGKLMYPSTSGHVPTCVYMSHRTNEPFVPEHQRKQCVSVVYCCVGGNMSDENLEQRINFQVLCDDW
jgi:hypothetical protein